MTERQVPANVCAPATLRRSLRAMQEHFDRKRNRTWALAIFVGSLLIYGAVCGQTLLEPSPHFHFTDMAESFLHGRLDTDTPRRTAGQKPQPNDPPGLQDAVNRQLKGSGWNDWASYRVLTLRGGEVVKGVFPWKDVPGPRQHEFHTLDGRLMIIDVDRDLKVGCDPKQKWRKCDDVIYQISFPPFPAVVMMPLAKIWHYRANDVLVTVLFAALSALLTWLWLARLRREELITHDTADRAWLTAFLAFGTATFFVSAHASVWFTALVIGMTLHLGYLLAAEGGRRPFLAGVLLGLGVATRTPLLFAGLFLPLEVLFPDGRWLGGQGKSAIPEAFKKLALYAIPLALIGGVLAWFNWARWENPGEFGHLYLLEGTRGPTREHGLFSFTFLNHNLGTALLNMPQFVADTPVVLITRHGLGLLTSSPAFLALLAQRPTSAPQESSRSAALSRHLMWSVAAVAIPGLFYQNDGWQQFSYRFAMDFLPPLLGILALRLPVLNRKVKALIVLSVVIQLFGAITFGRAEQFYYD